MKQFLEDVYYTLATYLYLYPQILYFRLGVWLLARQNAKLRAEHERLLEACGQSSDIAS